MKKAVKSFLGVKKRKNHNVIDNRDAPANYNSNLKKSRSKYGSMNYLNEPRRERQAPKRSQSFTGLRTASMPQSTRERVEEWNRNSEPEFEQAPSWANEDFFDESENISRRTQSLHQRKRSTRNTNSIDRRTPRYPSKRDLAEWKHDYERKSGQTKSRTQSYRDSGAFDLYVNDNVNSTVMPEDSVSMGRTLSKSSTVPGRRLHSNPAASSRSMPRLSSNATSQSRGRTVSHVSQASDKLFSCMSALDRLTLKLENADQISTEVDQFRDVSEKIASVDCSAKGEPFYAEPGPGGKCEWKIGNDRIPRHNSVITQEDFKRGRHKSEDNSSTDSGVNINEYENKGPANNPPSRPRSSNQRYPELDYKNPQMYEQQQKFQEQQKYRQQQQQPQTWYPHPNRYPKLLQPHLRSDSMSSGYSSGSGGNPTPPLQQNYAQHNSPLAVNNISASHNDPRYAMHGYDEQAYNYSQGYDTNYGNEAGYVEEDPYGYGTYGGYASSSIYDEDIHQQNGWFYLPTAHQTAYPQTAAPQYQQQYQSYSNNQYPYTHTTPHYPSYNDPSQAWTGAKYGDLSESFLNPAAGITPLAAALSSQCNDQADAESQVSVSDWKKYGSFRSKNGERAFMSATDVAASRRKTVRFNQTVKQRVMESAESEIEDSTSVIKGCTSEEVYDSPTSNNQAGKNVCPHSLTQHPIYEFPSGHIESSCMCSDCILARSSSQVKPASSYAYY